MSRILIVDDQPENRRMLRFMLQRNGYTVDEANDGAEALTRSESSLPDLVISDLLMPVMDGFTLLRRWKTDSRLCASAFIVYTASYTDVKDEQLAMDLGADLFLAKPTESEPFLAKITETLEKKQRGELNAPRVAAQGESIILKQYNDVLIRKLEEKLGEIKQTNQALNQEIAEHKQARQELQQASELLTAVTNGTSDAVFVKDCDGRYLLCNPAAANFMAREPAEVIGHLDSDFFDAKSAQIIMQNDRNVMNSSSVQTKEEHLTAAGTTRTYLATKWPYSNCDGQTIGIIGISRDITDRKLAEEALREREEMLALLLDSTAEGIFGLGLDGKCTFANRACAQLLGHEDSSQLIGRDLHAEMHRCQANDDADGAKACPVYAAIRSGDYVHLDAEEFWRADDTTFDAEYFSYPIRRNGEIVGSVATFLDVTKRKKLEEQLHHSQKMDAIGRLAGGVAHDFNNLLSVIMGYADFAMDSLPVDGPVYKDVKQVRLAADKAAALTRQLLVFSRKQVLKSVSLAINNIITESKMLLQRLIGEDVELDFIPDPLLGHVKADASQIEQVVLNLVVNARDAMAKGGRITIKTSNLDLLEPFVATQTSASPGRYVMITVTDTGCGMDAETVTKIFEPFFTTKAAGKGTGLGLATVYGIVQQSGGHISVYSELGLGTTFKVLLPRIDDGPIEGKATEIAAVPGGTETILLVEDDAALRSLGQRILETAGYKVLSSCDGVDALRIANEYSGPIDLVLTDVVMPHLSGRELTLQLAQTRPGLRVLYMSGFTDDAIVRHGITTDSLNVIEKPFTAGALTLRVKEILGQSRR